MNRSLVIAGVIAIGTVAWIASGQMGGAEQQTQLKPPVVVEDLVTLTPVRIRSLTAEPHAPEILLRGATEARRLVDLRAETSGRILEILVPEGETVKAGTPLARLDEAERAALLKQAEALLAQRRIEYEAAEKLSKKGYRSETDLAAAAAALQAAEAEVEAASVELAHTQLPAPFDGVVERHLMKPGAYADHGDAIIRLVELDPLLVVAYADEQEILSFRVGDQGEARLRNGRVLPGRVTFVAAVGEDATRTFRVELSLDNPNHSLPAGITADLAVSLPEVEAYKVSPALLVLDERGRLGVKALDEADRVIFLPVTLVDDEADGIWLGGLPPKLRIITVGQEYVKIGQQVKPIDENAIGGGSGSGS